MKELCKIKKSHRQKHLATYIELVNKPKHVCRKCGRVANKKKLLCKPVSMKSKRHSSVSILRACAEEL